MPLFKKKKEPKKSNVYMPIRKSNTPVSKDRGKKLTIFNKKSSSPRLRSKGLSVPPFLKIFVLFIFISALLYFSVIFVMNMRNNNPLDDYEKTYVVGIEEIPTYPLSEFIFSNSIEEPSVANFLSAGNSAYRLPNGESIEDVYEYYLNELSNLGWIHTLSVPVGSEEMKSGEYWIKEDKGLRIYSKFNDVWYEVVTVEEAQSGLSERVKKEVEKDLLLANQELQDLLPDFPWVLKVPKEYVIAYRSANFKDFRMVEFKKIGSSETISLIPIASSDGKALDTHLDNYIKNINKDSEFNWGVTRTTVMYLSYGRGIQGTISGGNEINEIALMTNPNDSIVYLLRCNELESPFFEFILSNLTPQDTFKY